MLALLGHMQVTRSLNPAFKSTNLSATGTVSNLMPGMQIVSIHIILPSTYINAVDILLNGQVPTGVNVGSLTSKKPRIYQ